MKPNALGSGVLAALIAASAAASQVGDLTTFTAGTPARASEVNANFDALKNAVNDIDARITAVENSKQDRITGGCSAGMAVAAIAADGSVTCEQVRPSEGSVSVHAVSFQNYSGLLDCSYRTADLRSGYFSGAETNFCSAAAQVQLPQGAEVSGMSCLVDDSEPGMRWVSVDFVRYPLPREVPASLSPDALTPPVFSSGSSDTNALQVLTITPAADATNTIVDNKNYTYLIIARFYLSGTGTFTTVGTRLGLYGCTVDYRH